MYEVILINGARETVIHSPYFNELKLQASQIKQGINVANGLTFSLMPNSPEYNAIRPLKTLVKVFNTKTQKYEFEGRILMPTESMSDGGEFGKSFICESELGYLNDSAQRHGEYHDITVRDFLQVIIDNHNADVAGDDIDKTFTLGIVDVDSSTGTLYRYLGYESTFDTIQDKLIDRLGGELRIRKVDGIRYLDYLQSTAEYKTTEIRLSKNLKSITKETDPSDVITRLIPLGERIESEDENATDASEARLTIETVNNGKDYIDDLEAMAVFGVIAKSNAWDDITQPNILKTTGQKYLQENNRVKSKYQVSAVDLSIIGLDIDSFEIGNYYPVINPIMGIDEDLRVIGKTIDLLAPETSSLEIGDKFMTASEYQNQANKSQQIIVDLENTVIRQSQRLASIRTELDNVDGAIGNIQDALNEADIPALEQAVTDLNNAIDNLNDAIDSIPVYDPATPQKDGLMSAADKIKLNELENYDPATETENGLFSKEDKYKLNLISVLNNIDLDSIKRKLDLITVLNDVNLDDLSNKLELISVANPVDLDDLKQRVYDLENP